MAWSINFNGFNPFDHWFSKPHKPLPPLNLLLSLPNSLSSHLGRPTSTNPFASLSSSSSSSSSSSPASSPPTITSGLLDEALGDKKAEYEKEPKGPYTQMLEQFFWECENNPDYRYAPEVEKILNEDPIFEKKENPTEEEIKENEKFWKELRDSPIVKFLLRAEEIADAVNELELEENKHPYRKEDRELWRSVPHVIGPDGRPMPRKAIRTKKESDDKFWDFARQFFFGLWGFQQRPYPPERPIDVAQAIGYKRLENRYYDFIMRSGGFYYKDRLGRTRGPCELIQLKTAWGAGIIDKHTFIWGEDMDEWTPIHMVYGMERAIATWEVKLGAAATAFLHKLQKGIPPWVPLKGHEEKTYAEAQKEAYESKRRDMAVLEANDGVWPGVRIPSHALFLWASGSELTTVLEKDHMPNKYIPKDLRRQLAEIIPGLRPWEVLSVEQAMDQITYGGEWYREPLGTYTTGPPYIREWNLDLLEYLRSYMKVNNLAAEKLRKTVPGIEQVMEKVYADVEERLKKREERRTAKKRAQDEEELYRKIVGDE